MAKKQLQEFVERMGLAAEADGLPRIAGRMFAFFVLEGGTHSFSELAEKLKVSRGSVSTNARMLESLGILDRITQPGDRQDYFRLAADPYGQLLEGYVHRQRRIQDLVTTTLDAVPKADKQMRSRLQEMERFYDAAIESTLTVLDDWHGKSNNRKRA